MTHEAATRTAPQDVMELTVQELAAVSGGALPLLPIAGYALAAFGVGYAIGTFAYNHNFPGTHWA